MWYTINYLWIWPFMCHHWFPTRKAFIDKVWTLKNNKNLRPFFFIQSSKMEFIFFTYISPDYMGHDINKKFWKNMTAGFIKVNIGRFLYNLKFIKWKQKSFCLFPYQCNSTNKVYTLYSIIITRLLNFNSTQQGSRGHVGNCCLGSRFYAQLFKILDNSFAHLN